MCHIYAIYPWFHVFVFGSLRIIGIGFVFLTPIDDTVRSARCFYEQRLISQFV
jgi:hypothetical protein